VSSFDQKAKSWDKNSRRQAVAKAVARAIEGCVGSKNKRVLDFGCGTGLISYNLKSKNILGIDTSAKMVEIFNQKSPTSSIKAICSSLEDIDEKFNLIVSSMTLHHIKDIASLIKEFKSHLHKGGAVCIADLEREDGSFHTHGNEGVEHFGFEPKELVSLFEKEGFRLICHKRVFIIKKAKEYPLFLVCFYLA